MGKRAVNLGQGDKMGAGRDRIDNAGAIFRHRLRRIMAARTAIERIIETAGDAAVTPKKTVRDAGTVKIGTAMERNLGHVRNREESRWQAGQRQAP